MDSNKEIKVYGTLVNHTQNYSIMDNDHNDAVVYAKQSYDDRFGVTPNADNFQDVINKRVTAISYADGITTVKNRADVPDGNPYMFKVEGASNLHGNTTVDGNVTVNGATALNGTLTANGVTTVNNTLRSIGKITADSGIDIAGGNLDVQNGDAHIKNNLTVDGTANITGNTTLTTLHTTGSVEIDGNEKVHGTLTVDGVTTIDDNLRVTGTADIAGATTLENTLNVAGKTTLANDLELSNGDAIIKGDLSVRDSISGQDLSISDDAVIGGHLDVASIKATGGLDVTGVTVLRSNTSIGGSLSTVGDTTLGGALSVAGTSTTGSIISNGNISTPNGEISGKTLHITSNGNIDGTTTTGKLIVTSDGVTIASGDLAVNNGNFNVDGAADISENTRINGTLDVIGATTLNSPTTINSTLAVRGTSSFDGNMTTGGSITSSGNVTAPNITDTNNPNSLIAIINKINGDKTVEGSFRKAVDDLY